MAFIHTQIFINPLLISLQALFQTLGMQQTARWICPCPGRQKSKQKIGGTFRRAPYPSLGTLQKATVQGLPEE